MKREELEAIKRRAEAATPGEWKQAHPWGPPDEHGYVSMPGIFAGETSVVFGTKGYADISFKEADAEFIAASRQDVPALVVEVEKLRILLEQVLPQLDSYGDGLSYFPQRAERIKFLAFMVREALGEE
jgi:hypothetical protein